MELGVIVFFLCCFLLYLMLSRSTKEQENSREFLLSIREYKESTVEVPDIEYSEEIEGKTIIEIADPDDQLPVAKTSIQPDMKLSDFKGQEKAKRVIKLNLDECIRNPEFVFPHTLFTGSGGTGKTTAAECLGNELQKKFFFTSPHMLGTPVRIFEFFFSKDLSCKINKGDIVFIDEVHSFTEKMGSYIYNILQDFAFDWKDEEGNPMRLAIPQFTCIGATTDAGLLHPPLVSRFVNQIEFEDYTVEQLVDIGRGVFPELNDDAAFMIAKRSAGVPREVKRLSLVSSLVAKNFGSTVITTMHVKEACDIAGVDELGLDRNARKVIDFFIQRENKPAGTAAISAGIRVYKNTLDGQTFHKMTYAKVLEMTRQGKKLTDKFYDHLLDERR